MRHGYAAMLNKASIDPKAMANQLGHAKADISVNRYSSIDLCFVQGQMAKLRP
ncbi:MAG: hypothetical protein LBC69_04345 [Eubacteriaceae bacterium]|nr:hypothetical protein [Eubacteriaceae bacterium]